MFGLHLHGQIISQLIGQADGSLTPLEASAQRFANVHLGALIDGGWTWFWTMLGGALVLLILSPFWLIVGAGIILVVLIASTALAFVLLNWWLPVVPPTLGAALALTFGVVYVMALARNEREHIMALFAGVVSKGVADDIWRRRDRPDDRALQLMTATVMFSDIKGFTTISEKLSEPVLADWLNDYMAVMVDIIADHGGVIEKFAGDGLTVEFGVPEPRTTEDEIDADAKAAVDCALAMAACLPELNASWQAKGLPVIGIRVGIHTGPLMVGAIGSADRWQYSIIGDTANTAARLEGYGKDDPKLAADVGECRTLISDATLQRLSNGYQTDFVGEAALKGKAQTVGVYRLLGRRVSPVEDVGTTRH
jgi:adenylate cyclase